MPVSMVTYVVVINNGHFRKIVKTCVYFHALIFHRYTSDKIQQLVLRSNCFNVWHKYDLIWRTHNIGKYFSTLNSHEKTTVCQDNSCKKKKQAKITNDTALHSILYSVGRHIRDTHTTHILADYWQVIIETCLFGWEWMMHGYNGDWGVSDKTHRLCCVERKPAQLKRMFCIKRVFPYEEEWRLAICL